MRKYFFIIVALVITSYCHSQKIDISHHSISSLSTYSIVGKVGNNIIVWSIVNDRKSSEIIVYDDNLKFIKKVSSGILKTVIDPNPTFFNNSDSFYVAYKYLENKIWKYKLACFDSNANMLSDKAIDSLKIGSATKDTTFYFYRFLQSPDKRTICFTKFTYDAKNFILHFNCSFIYDKEIANKNFVIPFDINNEHLNDILIDSDRNLFFVMDSQEDSVSAIKLIKKVYTDDYMLIVKKVISKGTLIPESINITKSADNNYIIYTAIDIKINPVKDTALPHTGFYVCKLDEALNDKPGDTTFIDSAITGLNQIDIFYVGSAIPKQTLFVVENKISYRQNIYAAPIYSYNNSGAMTPDAGEFNVEEEARRGILTGRGLGAFVPLNNNVGQPSNEMYNRIPFDNKNMEALTKTIVNRFILVNLNELNEINWIKDISSVLNNSQANTVSGAGIFATANNIHILYSITDNKKNFIKHLVINSSGKMNDEIAFTWNSSFTYMINEAMQLSNTEIIFPMYKSGRISFAKLNLK